MGGGGQSAYPGTYDNGIPFFRHIERHITGFDAEQEELAISVSFDFFSF
jgi:hypothetical protein